MTEYISALTIPSVLLVLGFFLFFDKKDYFKAFCDGAKEGLSVTVGLIPTMVLIMTALSMLFASGALEFLQENTGSFFASLGIPAKTLPLVLTRSFSGSATFATFTKLLTDCGADSFPAFAASVIMGCGDTLVYIISVYFSAAKGVRRTAYAIPVAVTVMIFSVFFSCFLARLWY